MNNFKDTIEGLIIALKHNLLTEEEIKIILKKLIKKFV